jgi:hypothetical protein
MRLHRPEANQERLVFRCLPAHQKVDRHIPAGVHLQRAEALNALPGQLFY